MRQWKFSNAQIMKNWLPFTCNSKYFMVNVMGWWTFYPHRHLCCTIHKYMSWGIYQGSCDGEEEAFGNIVLPVEKKSVGSTWKPVYSRAENWWQWADKTNMDTTKRLPDSQTCEERTSQNVASQHSKTSFSKFFSKPTHGWLVLRKQDPGYHEARLGANLAFTH